ncbi:MAG: hypothetical protein KDK48_05030 [Chlamydiia bacterium]|nr:hypothetical protein [Chlamydiia bacterium]
MSDLLDGFGVTGAIFALSLATFFFLSSLLVFVSLWRSKELHFDESPKLSMMDQED